MQIVQLSAQIDRKSKMHAKNEEVAFQEIGKSVIVREANALKTLAHSIDGQFINAVSLLSSIQGRVIVSGIGKSGHIARKIAATFASTGKPAYFVHPAEASHGDLGMVTANDCALILSNSGETSELADIIAYARRFHIPIIGVASVPDSTLIQQATVGLILPKEKEACDDNIVPTTSTTMMLALGDALAIALMKKTNFTPALFREFHPGGALGAKLSRVGDLMHVGNKIPLISEDTAMSDALLMMTKKGFGVVGIYSTEFTLTGIITDGDLRRHMDGLLQYRAREVMTHNPLTIDPNALVEEAMGLMNKHKITSLFVVAKHPQQVEGIIHIHDCLRIGAT